MVGGFRRRPDDRGLYDDDRTPWRGKNRFNKNPDRKDGLPRRAGPTLRGHCEAKRKVKIAHAREIGKGIFNRREEIFASFLENNKTTHSMKRMNQIIQRTQRHQINHSCNRFNSIITTMTVTRNLHKNYIDTARVEIDSNFRQISELNRISDGVNQELGTTMIVPCIHDDSNQFKFKLDTHQVIIIVSE